MIRKMFIVGALKETLGIEMHNGHVYDVACSWADGMIGAFPAFYDEKAAQTYAGDGGRYQVIEFLVDVPERN